MGKKFKPHRGNTRQQTEPSQQEVNLVIEAFRYNRHIEMEALGRKMTLNFPHSTVGWKAVGTALFQQGRYIEALQPLQKAAGLSPKDPQLLNILGNSLKSLRRYTEAEKHYRNAIKLSPNLAEGHYNLGSVLYEQKQYIEAEACCRNSLALMPTAVGYNGLANVLYEQHQYIKSESCYRQSLALIPTAAGYNGLANSLLRQGRHAEAEANYNASLKADPQCDTAIVQLGRLKMNSGAMAQAEELFLRALSINANNTEARYSITQLKKVAPGDANFLALVATEKHIRESRTPPPKNMATIHFALGKSYADIGAHDQSFSHFISGCKLQHASLKRDKTQEQHYFDRIIEVFNSTILSRLSRGGNTSSAPIFIVGMTRSGTTLTEQIIASHPDVHGAGELKYLGDVSNKKSGGTLTYPNNIAALSHVELIQWADDYLAALQQHAPTAQRITDKMPGNFLSIGLIHLILPNAKIIHVSRHPLDNCISCFTQLFENGHAYSYDLKTLGHYYANYMRLMEHWRKVLPSNAFFEVRYEDIVADKETQARRLIKYCDLEWNEACLDFHKNKRSVHTASVTQVRQPIYTSSVARWKSYEKFLDPLIDALGDSIQKFESPH
jgi:tetratricopeptide (TPR) repeat protein